MFEIVSGIISYSLTLAVLPLPVGGAGSEGSLYPDS